MKGDFTRLTFQKENHYRNVLTQQGRVQLDSDWNEQLDIQTYLDETTTGDVIGAHGGPLEDGGFELVISDGDGSPEMFITAGRYYVDGILVENEEDVALTQQPDLPGVQLPTADGPYVAVLDVWREHVTALEEPALREVALGGPDTTTRSRTIWQVWLERFEDDSSFVCTSAAWSVRPEEGGRLRARAEVRDESENPCLIPATAGYRRLENQLYRVEIHTGSGAEGGPTYVWSRDNGSVAAKLIAVDDGPPVKLTIGAPGRDERLGFAKNNWVEVIDAARVRRGEPGFLGRLDDAVGTELTVGEWAGAVPAEGDLGDNAVVRRWDSNGPVAVTTEWTDLEDGVRIQFETEAETEDSVGGSFRTGDYWLIPARTADLRGGAADQGLAGNVEWPVDDEGEPRFTDKQGVEHHRTAIALLTLSEGTWTRVSDCRRVFSPLTELIDMEYAGGDGQECMPGDPLPRPLEVSVHNGTTPVEGALVLFHAPEGVLADNPDALPGSDLLMLEVRTDGSGVARGYWLPNRDGGRPTQQATVSLLDDLRRPIGASIDFTARFSVADQVWYDSDGCAALSDQHTVQGVIDRLASALSLVAVGGDGQDGLPGTALPHPVAVQVRSDCGPAPRDTKVRFEVDSGAVGRTAADLGNGATTVDLATDDQGVARCLWRLGTTDQVQVLRTGLLLGRAVATEEPTRLAFTANLRGDGAKPGLHVKDVIVLNGNTSLPNDSTITVDRLVEGVAVVLDGRANPELVDDKPVLTLTTGYPLFVSSNNTTTLAGQLPVVIAGRARATNELVRWLPTSPVAVLLNQLLDAMRQSGQPERLLCELQLYGRSISDANDPDHVVNGLTLPDPRDGRIGFPSVDDVRGADFRLWFWVVRAGVVLLPTRAGRFRMKSAQDIIASTRPPAPARVDLPPGVAAAPKQTPDPDAARRAADRAFRGPDTERRLVLIAAPNHTEAADALRTTLADLEVELEVIITDEPAETARTRMEAGEQLDGIITDTESASTFPHVIDLGEAIPL